jgi:glycine cleavage system transcriptional repressor
MPNYIVTVTAADRVGIVHSVTGTIHEHGGNILELSQTVLRDYFTIILAVEFPEPRNPRTLSAAIIANGAKFDLNVEVIDAEVTRSDPIMMQGDRFILTVLGADRPGNIHGISGCLAKHGVNIVDLHARSDADRFSMIMEAFLPPDLEPGTVRDELERFGRNLGLETYVQHENIFLATTEPSPVRVGLAPTISREGAAVVPH